MAARRTLGPETVLEETGAAPLLRWCRRTWERRKERAFPPGAVTFHLEAWGRRRMTPALEAQARGVADVFGLDPIWIVHGCALLLGGDAAVLAGPPGLGKSRLLFELERRGEGRCLDDGLVLLGVGRGRLRLVETGTLAFARRGFRISLLLRRLLLIDRSVFSTPAPLHHRRTRLLDRALCRVADLAFKLNVALPRGRLAPHEPGDVPVSHFVVAAHSEDQYPSFRLDGARSFAAIRDLGAEFAPYAHVHRVSPLGSRAEVARRIRSALLAPVAT